MRQFYPFYILSQFALPSCQMTADLVFLVTSSVTVEAFLRKQPSFLSQHGFKIAVICAPDGDLHGVVETEQTIVRHVPMEREISPPRDMLALWRVYRTLRQLHPTIVNASTPKAGLLGMLAAWLARIPVRVYQQRGLRLETTDGIKRQILMGAEWLAARCATVIVCNSHSLLENFAVLGLASRSKLRVLGAGSSNGVAVARFRATPERLVQASQIRQALGIPSRSLVLGFVGRLTRDKGIVELIALFERLQDQFPDLHLLLIGDYEEGDPVPQDTRHRITESPRIHAPGHISDPAPYYHVMDLLVFLSYREGFPNAPLEAAAAGVPTIGFRVTGVVDAVEDGETGRLVAPGDVDHLLEVTLKLLRDTDLRQQMGRQAFDRATRDFSQEQVWENWRQFYEGCLVNATSGG